MARKQKTKEKMIAVAFDLFHKNGIKQTSVDDILKATNTGKSQFYHYFGSKDGMIMAVINYVTGWTKETKSDTPYPYIVKSWQDIENWFNFFISMQEYNNYDRACPMMTIGNDLNDDQTDLRNKIKDITRHMYGQIKTFFDKQQANGALSKSINTGHLAQFAFTTLQGGLLLSKVERDNTPLKNAVKLYLDYVEQVKTQPNAPLQSVA